MADNKDKQEEIKTPERGVPTPEQSAPFEQEKVLEKREVLSDDKRVSAELRREIEMMELDDKTKGEAEAKAEKIEFLGEKEKIEHLLEIAREKGVVFAIHMVRKMNEPYLLDILHDTLAQEGYYKDFTK
jgi:hypothetical protein